MNVSNRGLHIARRVRKGWDDRHGLGEFVTTPDGRLTVPWNPVGTGMAGIGCDSLPTGYSGPASLGCSCNGGPVGLNGIGALPEFLSGDFTIMGTAIPKVAVYGGAAILLFSMMGGKGRR